ncbi:ADP-ribosylation factor-binding protein GGA1 like protein [Argiope bruennichi]|uniref:ADP-ribosylation factor-binding protein GGA1 like protein n=1 Tax=Argiope bruennichi TaxID=94029 RepID=A0A8T0EKZ3_ARGBR|nr:ADP-ribosylation factor-binding protein GGA1 like protein [Argiope bruennichi]
MATAEPNEDDNLETLLAKATNPLHRQPDSVAVSDFCTMIDKEHDGPQTALRLLAHKIQSPIEKESLMALSVLEECVRNCGIRFRSEIGKFRFLNEMIKVVSPKKKGLNHYKPGETSEEEKDLMKELFESCERLRPKLFRLAGELDEKDEGLSDILKANDELTVVINNYKRIMGVSSENGNISSKEASLLDLGSPVQQSQSSTQTVSSSLLDDQLLALGLNDSAKQVPAAPAERTNAIKNATHTSTSSSLADLDQIFSSSVNTESLPSSHPSISLPGTTSVISNNYSSSIFRSGDAPNIPSLTPLPPFSLATNPTPPSSTTVTSKGLEELDELGQSLLKKSLPDTPAVKCEFPSVPQKVPLSQLIQQKSQSKVDTSILNTTSSQDINDVPCLMSSSPLSDKISPACSPAHSILSLKDIFVPLETIQPGTLQPLNLHEKNGLNVVIHFGKDSPRPDITVMVVSTMSKNSSPVKNVSFQAAVPKSMKIKLQPPSATDLPPHNPILPPAAITQVMLLANPLKENVRFKYKVNYTINGEDYTDIGEVDSLLAPR